MNIAKSIELLPLSIKSDVQDFTQVKLKTGEIATRVLLTRLLTEKEKSALTRNKHIIGTDCVAYYRYAPEIKKSYFYVV